MSAAELLSVILIAFGLSADCFAVALSIGASGKSYSLKHMIRVSLAFGIFQMTMPLAGWLIGQTMVQILANYDHWIAFALLAFIGGKMIWEFIKDGKKTEGTDIENWGMLIALAVATSIDALAIGLSFSLLKMNILLACVIIGIVAFSVTAFSFWLGRKVSVLIGKWAYLAGGIILIGIGLRILITHMAE